MKQKSLFNRLLASPVTVAVIAVFVGDDGWLLAIPLLAAVVLVCRINQQMKW